MFERAQSCIEYNEQFFLRDLRLSAAGAMFYTFLTNVLSFFWQQFSSSWFKFRSYTMYMLIIMTYFSLKACLSKRFNFMLVSDTRPARNRRHFSCAKSSSSFVHIAPQVKAIQQVGLKLLWQTNGKTWILVQPCWNTRTVLFQVSFKLPHFYTAFL